jgi:hypothetical protein
MDVEKRRRQNLAAPRSDARGVTPSIRSFAQAIDSQGQRVEHVPLLRGGYERLLQLEDALALAVELDDPQAELLDFSAAARAVSVPVLRADLILEEFQVYETRAAGADALLLHADLLALEALERLYRAAASTHMIPVIVCQTPAHVARAAALKAQVVSLSEGLQAPPRTLTLGLRRDQRADAVLDEQITTPEALRALLEEQG